MASRCAVGGWNFPPSVILPDCAVQAETFIENEYGIVSRGPAIHFYNLLHPTIVRVIVVLTIASPNSARGVSAAAIDFAEGLIAERMPVQQVRAIRVSQLDPVSELRGLRVVDDRIVDSDSHAPPGQAPGVGMVRADLF